LITPIRLGRFLTTDLSTLTRPWLLVLAGKDIASNYDTALEVVALGPGMRSALINAAGLATLVTFTALVYLRTQEPLILLVGGLIATVSVVGTMMSRSD
jgi:hypothetical protein